MSIFPQPCTSAVRRHTGQERGHCTPPPLPRRPGASCPSTPPKSPRGSEEAPEAGKRGVCPSAWRRRRRGRRRRRCRREARHQAAQADGDTGAGEVDVVAETGPEGGASAAGDVSAVRRRGRRHGGGGRGRVGGGEDGLRGASWLSRWLDRAGATLGAKRKSRSQEGGSFQLGKGDGRAEGRDTGKKHPWACKDSQQRRRPVSRLHERHCPGIARGSRETMGFRRWRHLVGIRVTDGPACLAALSENRDDPRALRIPMGGTILPDRSRYRGFRTSGAHLATVIFLGYMRMVQQGTF